MCCWGGLVVELGCCCSNRKSESWIKAEQLASLGNAHDLGFAVPHIALLILDPSQIVTITTKSEKTRGKTCIWHMGGLRSSFSSKDCVHLHTRLCTSKSSIARCSLSPPLTLNFGALPRYMDPCFTGCVVGFCINSFVF